VLSNLNGNIVFCIISLTLLVFISPFGWYFISPETFKPRGCPLSHYLTSIPLQILTLFWI